MKLLVLAVGQRMPAWVTAAWDDYTRRMPADYAVELREMKPEPRTVGKTPTQMMQAEAARIRAALPPNATIVALDEAGRDLSTAALTQQLQAWREQAQHVAFLIGGPDGLDEALKRAAHARIRLSSLTLPHPMVRVLLAEQLYRAWSIQAGHPYHRA